MDLLQKLRGISDVEVYSDVGGDRYSTFRSGGRIRCMIAPRSVDSLCSIIELLNSENISFHLLGLGANTLIDEQGVDIPIIYIGRIKGVEVQKSEHNVAFVSACCGVTIAELGRICSEKCLGGLEWSTGIPSTVGAAVYNNIGAYGYQISDVLHSVMCYMNGSIVTLDASQLNMEYRNSIFKRRGDVVILRVAFRLSRRPFGDIERDRSAYLARRLETQPSLPSLGSAFLHSEEGKSIAPYIDELGLKGAFYGGAAVSDKHCGFVVNTGGATATDYLLLCDSIQKKVYRKYGIRFFAEIEYIGRPNEYYDRLKGRAARASDN